MKSRLNVVKESNIPDVDVAVISSGIESFKF